MRFLKSGTYKATFAGFETSLNSILQTLTLSTATDNEERRKFEHQRFVSDFHESIEVVCNEIGQARDENKRNCETILDEVRSTSAQQQAVIDRLRSLEENATEVLKMQEKNRVEMLERMCVEPIELSRVLQDMVDAGRDAIRIEIDKANASLSDQLSAMQVHTAQELRIFSGTLTTKMEDMSTLLDDRFKRLNNSMEQITQDMGAVNEKVEHVLDDLHKCTTTLNTQIEKVGEENKASFAELRELIASGQADSAAKCEEIKESVISRLSSLQEDQVTEWKASQLRLMQKTKDSMKADSAREQKYTRDVLLGAMKANNSALLARSQNVESSMLKQIEEMKEGLSGELLASLTSMQAALSNQLGVVRDGIEEKFEFINTALKSSVRELSTVNVKVDQAIAIVTSGTNLINAQIAKASEENKAELEKLHKELFFSQATSASRLEQIELATGENKSELRRLHDALLAGQDTSAARIDEANDRFNVKLADLNAKMADVLAAGKQQAQELKNLVVSEGAANSEQIRKALIDALNKSAESMRIEFENSQDVVTEQLKSMTDQFSSQLTDLDFTIRDHYGNLQHQHDNVTSLLSDIAALCRSMDGKLDEVLRFCLEMMQAVSKLGQNVDEIHGWKAQLDDMKKSGQATEEAVEAIRQNLKSKMERTFPRGFCAYPRCWTQSDMAIKKDGKPFKHSAVPNGLSDCPGCKLQYASTLPLRAPSRGVCEVCCKVVAVKPNSGSPRKHVNAITGEDPCAGCAVRQLEPAKTPMRGGDGVGGAGGGGGCGGEGGGSGGGGKYGGGGSMSAAPPRVPIETPSPGAKMRGNCAVCGKEVALNKDGRPNGNHKPCKGVDRPALSLYDSSAAAGGGGGAGGGTDTPVKGKDAAVAGTPPSGAKMRGSCAVCGKEVALNKDGRPNGNHKPCKGVDKPALSLLASP